MLVARKANPTSRVAEWRLRRPGRHDLRRATQLAWVDAGLSGREAARLVRDLLWVQMESTGEDNHRSSMSVSERVTPRSNLAKHRAPVHLAALRVTSSACPSWMVPADS